MLSRIFNESDGQLSVNFGYQCIHKEENPCNIYEEVSSEVSGKSLKSKRNKSSFSFLSGAALSANATLANTNICNGLIGTEILPGLDSPRTFQRLPSSPSLSSIDILSSSFQSNGSILSGCVSSHSDCSEWDLSMLKSLSAPSKSEGFLNALEVEMAGGAAGEDRVQAVCSEENGWLFCSIYDGFNGRDAADFLAGTLYENIGLYLNILDSQKEEMPSDLWTNKVLNCLQQALVQAESDFLSMVEQEMDNRPDLVSIGSCVLVVLLHGDDLYTLSLGDSRAILATSEGANINANENLSAIQLNDCHSVDNDVERMRLLADHPDDPKTIVGGKVKGKLKLTRAFGVGYLKMKKLNDALMGILRVRNLLSPPYISAQPSRNYHKISKDDNFVVVASDGLFDFFDNEDIIKYVSHFLKSSPLGNPAKFLVEKLVDVAAKRAGLSLAALMSIAPGLRRDYHDDVTVIVILLGGNQRTTTASTYQ